MTIKTHQPLPSSFFNADATKVARALLGKVIHVKYQNIWLTAKIIETEAYYKVEKGSHASLGYTEKRKALFMPPGTIYMYYARGGDSLNISCRGDGNAVLIKSGIPFIHAATPAEMLTTMQQLNPHKNKTAPRSLHELCNGQTLLCKSLSLKVTQWDQRQFDHQRFYFANANYQPEKVIQTTRLGIPPGRDEHLLYRFIDFDYAQHCTQNPLRKRNWQQDKDYYIIEF